MRLAGASEEKTRDCCNAENTFHRGTGRVNTKGYDYQAFPEPGSTVETHLFKGARK